MKINYKTNNGDSIFHFTKFSTAVEYILPQRQLKLSSLINTNDPREYKSYGFGVKNGFFDEDQKINQQLSWNQKISDLLREKVKVLCFSTDYVYNDEPFDGYNLPRMWAQYGENHLGICLDIDFDRFIEENKDFIADCKKDKISYLSRIKYPNIDFDKIKEFGINSYVSEYRQANFSKLFFTKFIDWETEREFRILYVDNADIDRYLSIKKSLNRIILGMEFKECFLPIIFKLANNTPVESLHYINNNFVSFRFKEDYMRDYMKI